MRPRILFVPIFAGFEARPFAAGVGAWADVESFDGPGAGSRRDEAAGGIEAMAAAGADRIGELGWDRCVLVADSHAQASAIELALGDPRVVGICISHAAIGYTHDGERPALSPAVHGAAAQLLESDLRSFGHALMQLTQGRIDEQWVEAFLESVPRATAHARMAQLSGRPLAARLAGAELAILLAKHEGCLMWTPEGFADAAAAVPDAATVACDEVPIANEGFHEAVRSLCERVFG